MYANNDAVIPKILPSNPHGNEMLSCSSAIVVIPPTSIAVIAAVELGFWVNKAAKTGINKPDTINAYELSIKSKTLVICSARMSAKLPIISVISCDALSCDFVPFLYLKIF